MNTQSVIHVECYSGYRGEETPIRFLLEERKLEVTEVVDQWIDPDCRYFKVKGNDGRTYLLRHEVWDDRWCLGGEADQGLSAY